MQFKQAQSDPLASESQVNPSNKPRTKISTDVNNGPKAMAFVSGPALIILALSMDSTKLNIIGDGGGAKQTDVKIDASDAHVACVDRLNTHWLIVADPKIDQAPAWSDLRAQIADKSLPAFDTVYQHVADLPKETRIGRTGDAEGKLLKVDEDDAIIAARFTSYGVTYTTGDNALCFTEWGDLDTYLDDSDIKAKANFTIVAKLADDVKILSISHRDNKNVLILNTTDGMYAVDMSRVRYGGTVAKVAKIDENSEEFQNGNFVGWKQGDDIGRAAIVKATRTVEGTTANVVFLDQANLPKTLKNYGPKRAAVG